MATHKVASVTLSLWLLALAPSCLGQMWPWQSLPRQSHQVGRQRFQEGHQRNKCDLQQLTASEPSRRIRAEAGTTEIWDQYEDQFQCAGVVALRHTIEPGGLFLPSYTNAPYITYVIQAAGRGIQGAVVPGCPPTFESESESESGHRRPEERIRRSAARRSEGREEEDRERYSRDEDQHQKLARIRQGDIVTSPAGVVQWTYNDGDSPLVAVTIIDTSNYGNQLDQNHRSFYLAGQSQGEHRQRPHHHRRERGGRFSEGEQEETSEGSNIFSGFDKEILQEVFQADEETISNIQGERDNRGNIVQARDLNLRLPEEYEEEEEEYEEHRRGGRGRRPFIPRREEGEGRRRSMRKRTDIRSNGADEASICNLKYKFNIDRPSQSDVFNPRAGRIHTLNSNTLPILQHLQLNAERVVLYQNALVPPKYNVNAHGIVYVTQGRGRIQVVNHEGRLVFDDVVEEGQILVVPQNFAVVKRAGREGLEFVEFKTNDVAISSPLAGRDSVIRGLPAEVVAASYQISREEAQRFKNSRRESQVFRPFSEQSRREERQGTQYAIV